MSVYLKPGQLKIKDENGDYTGINTVALESTAEYLEQIETKGDQIMDDIEAKGEETLESIPDDYTALSEEVDELNERMDTEGLSEDVKTALLTCFRHVAFLDDDADYYGALEDALYPYTGLVSISAVFSQGSAIIYNNAPLNDLKNYLTVIGHYADGTSKAETDYLLSGTLEVGTSTITVSKEGKTATFTVSVTKYPWDYEWTFTDGLLTDNGWTDISTDPGTATLVSDGLLIANEVSGAFSTNYAKDDFISDNIKAEYEIMFTNVYGVNDPRIILGLSINGATGLRLQLDESTAGVTEGTSVVTIPNTPFITNEWYKISSQLINGVASVAINDTTVYTSSNLATQYISKTNIAVVGGGSVKVKSIRYGRIS